MKTATVVIAATGAPVLEQAIRSALSQDYQDLTVWVVIDGPEFNDRCRLIISKFMDARLKVVTLPENTGANGFYGHRVYAAVSFLINTDYVLYLDQDNWMQPNHVSTQINNCESNGLDWGYSLRSVHDRDGNYLLDDNCESLGKWPIFLNDQAHLVDTSTYCIKREVITRIGGVWYGGWGWDRQFYANISHHFPRFGTTGLHTLCYRLDGNPGSVNADFFVQGNAVMAQRYGAVLPWNHA